MFFLNRAAVRARATMKSLDTRFVCARAALPKLIEALGDEEWGVVNAAVEALGEIRDANAVEPLVRLLQE